MFKKILNKIKKSIKTKNYFNYPMGGIEPKKPPIGPRPSPPREYSATKRLAEQKIIKVYYWKEKKNDYYTIYSSIFYDWNGNYLVGYIHGCFKISIL